MAFDQYARSTNERDKFVEDVNGNSTVRVRIVI